MVVHTPHNAIEWSGGDEPELTRSWAEFELQRHEQVVVVPRGKTRTVSLRLHGSVAPGDYHLDIGHQPLVHNDALTIEVNPTAGTYGDPLAPSDDRDLRAEFVLSRDTKLDAPWTALGERLPAGMIGGG